MLCGGRKGTLLFVLIGLLAAAGTPHAAWYSNIYVWTGLALLMSFAIIALAYMAGKFLEIPVLDAWTKVEMQEIATSASIAVLCMVLITTVNSASQFLSGEPNAITSAQTFLKDNVYADGQKLYLQLTEAYFKLARVVSYTYTVSQGVFIVAFTVSGSPGSGLSPMLASVSQGMDSVASFMMLASAQYSILGFFGSAAVIMLPVGIFLRSFSLTRKIGGTLLAAVIATAVIYPAAMMVSKVVYSTYSQDLTNTINGIKDVAMPPEPPVSDLICSPLMQMFDLSPLPWVGGEEGWGTVACWALGWIVPCPVLFAIIKIVFIVVNNTFGFIMAIPLNLYGEKVATFSKISANYYVPLTKYALPAVVKYIVLSITIFIIPVIMTVTLIKNLTLAFGGEPQLYGLSKLV